MKTAWPESTDAETLKTMNLGKLSLFCGRVFLFLYTLFVFDTIVGTKLIELLFVRVFPRFSIKSTSHLFGLMEKASLQTTASTSSSVSLLVNNIKTYAWIALHNELLVLCAAALFLLAIFIPQVKNLRVITYLVNYVQFVSVILFFAFGAVVFSVNLVLIPFILASVSYATVTPFYVLAGITLVHGIIEYIALSLIVMVAFQAWRTTRASTAIQDPDHSKRLRLKKTSIFSPIGNAVFTEDSIGRRFQTTVRPLKGVAGRIYFSAFLTFMLAAFVEVYVSPHVGLYLLQHITHH